MLIKIFDTETTGLLKPSPAKLENQPQIIEYYGVVVNEKGEFIRDFETFINPGIRLPDEIPKITGITDQMLVNAPSFLEVYPKIAELTTGVDLLVAHNLSYDSSMLANELLRIDKLINFPWPRHHVCTVEASMSIKGHRIKLCDLVEIATNKPLVNAHRAKDDVRGLYKAFFWLIKQGFIKLEKYEK